MLHISFPWCPPSPSPYSIRLQACLQGHAAVSQDARQLPSLLMYAHIGCSWSFSWKMKAILSPHGSQQSEGEIW